MLAGEWQNFKSETVSAVDASKLASKWQALSSYAIESAGYNAPELVLPILKQARNATVAIVQQAAELHFALPIHQNRIFNSSWATPLTASGSPHLGEGLKEATLTAFISTQTKPFLFQAIPVEGEFHQQLKRQSPRYETLELWERACLRPIGTYENWQQTNFTQKRRKEFKRLRNRLSEQGVLQTEILGQGVAVDSFTEEFLQLEASGWKGRKGTAIGADANLADALREALRNLHAAGKLRFWSLKLNGKSIAALFAIVEKNQAWLGKIAYDEAFSKFSPGALIILDCTEAFFAEPSITQVDSSAIPDHPLIDHIWRDRLAMISVFVGPETLSKKRFNFTVILAKQKLKWRSRLRDLYYQIKGKKRS